MFNQYLSNKKNLRSHILFAGTIILFIVFAFISNTPSEIFNGLIKIATTNDNLLSDYIAISNLGAAFFNAALVTMIAVITILLAKADVSGSIMAAVFTVAGFAFFGKDITNVIPIILGVYFASRYRKEEFKSNLAVALFATTMAPFVSAIMLYPGLNRFAAIALGIGAGIVVGFVLPYVVKVAFKIHNGFNLYNTGFSSGLILMIVVSMLKVFGFRIEPTLLWSSGNNFIISMFLISFYILLLVIAFIDSPRPQAKIKEFNQESGVAPSDFIEKFGLSSSLLNMFFIGVISHLYILIFNAPLNGPTLGGVFTIVGFGAYGKNVRNVVYILFGAFLGQLFGWWSLTTPVIMLGALFGTGIAPIAGKYGLVIGVIAIMLHIAVVQNVSALYFGLNLYNNGFAEGFTGFMIPAVASGILTNKFKEEKST
jgi:hypothetical protein